MNRYVNAIVFAFIMLLNGLLFSYKIETRKVDLADGGYSEEQGYNLLYNKTWVRQGNCRIFYGNGDLKSKGDYKSNKKDGHWISYFKNFNLKSEGDYKEGKKTGLWKTYHLSGGLASEGHYDSGKKVGLHKYWATNGQITLWQNYHYDDLHGEFAQWYETENPDRNPFIYAAYYCPVGKLLWYYGIEYNDKLMNDLNQTAKDTEGPAHPCLNGSFYFGKRDGEWKGWYKNGFPRLSIFYNKGKITDQARAWYPNGNPASIQFFLDGRKHGLWRYWYSSGVIMKEMSYKNDKLHGKYLEWYPTGIKKTIGTYKDGKRVGDWFFYEDNGKIFKGKKYPFD
ncbi:MAG: hypothetical protein JXA60_07035 [Candidatus Coatesbacteria bacterium]|nr:hypothetical protein [Candidatus Coatesbacteria bacterium]